MSLLFPALLLVGAFIYEPVIADGVVTCYYGSWSNERNGTGRFGVSDIPLDLCTHIIYSFIGLTADGDLTYPTEETIEGKSNAVEDLMDLKNSNSELKIMVAIGGWSEGSNNFSIVVNNDTLRANFVDNLYNYIDSNGFDGLDIDWEYPAQRGGADTDKEQFVVLVKELKEAFSNKSLILTAAVAVTQSNIDTSYDVVGLNKYLDYFHLMAYDYHGTWDGVTGVNAPLYSQLTDADTLNLNVNNSVVIWISNGASPEKLVLGLGSYGRTFTLSSLNDTSTGAAIDGAGAAGNYTQEAGIWSYYEICEDQKINPDNWSIVEVEESYVYATNDLFWVGYDNKNTTYAKAQYASDMGLGGIMYWAIDLDDFSGACDETYPLIKAGVAGFDAV